MIVMPANVTSPEVRSLMAEFPGMLGNLFSPGAWQTPHGVYALDNGRYINRGDHWSEADWRKLVDRAMSHVRKPEWVLCPDTVGDWPETQREWYRRESFLRGLGVGVAVAVQNGATVADVHAMCPNVVFVGGTTRWKIETAGMWTENFPRVHVARVNTVKRATACLNLGVESVDGTGWMMTTRQRRELRRMLLIMAGKFPRPLLLWRHDGSPNR